MRIYEDYLTANCQGQNDTARSSINVPSIREKTSMAILFIMIGWQRMVFNIDTDWF